MKIPTVREYLTVVEVASTPGARAAYTPYWRLLVEGWPETAASGKGHPGLGGLRLDEVRTTALKAGANEAKRRAKVRRGSRDGDSAMEHYVAAARAFFKSAVDDGYLVVSPAVKVEKPRRQPSRRMALSDDQLRSLWFAAANSGNDPALDVLLLRFHLETGARREGALNLRRGDLRSTRCTVVLREKFNSEREQPVSPTLRTQLLAHLAERAPDSPPTEALLRYSDGSPLTRRRYNTLFQRLQREEPWAGELGVSVHWLRHTAITQVERLTGSFATAQAFAGHTPTQVTSTYAKATIAEVARAHERRTREAHPLAAPMTHLAPIPKGLPF